MYEPSRPGSANVIAPFARALSRVPKPPGSPSDGPNPITISRVGESLPARDGKESRGRALERTFPYDNRMNELHGDVLGVRGIGALAKREQPAAAKKTVGHFAASFRRGKAPLAQKGHRRIWFRARRRCSICAARSGTSWPFSLFSLAAPTSTPLQQMRGSGSPTSISTIRLPP